MKIVMATGGTGGHLFPALKVAEELKSQGHAVSFMGSFSRGHGHMKKSGFGYEELGTQGLIGVKFPKIFGSVAAMLKGVNRAFRRLRQMKPDVVVGFGGYGAFPVVCAAFFLRCPTLIHEQNVVPGRANALLAKYVKRIAISFSESNRYFNPKKTVLTGCPCHLPREMPDRADIINRFGLETNKNTVFVFGGSQGSAVINRAFLDALRSLKERLDVQVIHVSGSQDYPGLKNEYHQIGIPFALFEFLDKMEEAYHVADLVISRAGAVTISEIAHFGLPAILVPYPHALGHQKENAGVLCKAGIAQMIEEKDMSPSGLSDAIFEALSAEPRMKNTDHICFPDAAERLSREIIKITR